MGSVEPLSVRARVVSLAGSVVARAFVCLVGRRYVIHGLSRQRTAFAFLMGCRVGLLRGINDAGCSGCARCGEGCNAFPVPVFVGRSNFLRYVNVGPAEGAPVVCGCSLGP